MYLAQANNIPGIHVVAIADINVKRAEGAFELVGWPKDQIAPDIATALGEPFHDDRGQRGRTV